MPARCCLTVGARRRGRPPPFAPTHLVALRALRGRQRLVGPSPCSARDRARCGALRPSWGPLALSYAPPGIAGGSPVANTRYCITPVVHSQTRLPNRRRYSSTPTHPTKNVSTKYRNCSFESAGGWPKRRGAHHAITEDRPEQGLTYGPSSSRRTGSTTCKSTCPMTTGGSGASTS